MKIRKVVIPAAGWGTRFLPATKAVPKEMLPLVGKPLIQYAVEEAMTSGIEQVVAVTAVGKEAIREHFSRSPELERVLEQKGKMRLLEQVRLIPELADIRYVYQKEQLGLGHAVLMAENVVGDEPFAVILPDDVIDAEVPALKQMLEVYHQYGGSVIAVERVSKENISGYGVIKAEKVSQNVYRILDMVEKPKPQDAPSDLGIVGRYIINPQIFDALHKTHSGAVGEIQLTDGLKRLLKEQPMYACEFEGVRYDTGTPQGMLKASVSLGLKDPDIGTELRKYLRCLI
ncbi:MAG: UTP--glucose-1-phosphate uridylyltransferase GalU [Dehalococcoidia bacterium]|nr:UTP--glucose-1-phosphate uridylyltransferase GalU [Dehalococcoidia bacterium]